MIRCGEAAPIDYDWIARRAKLMVGPTFKAYEARSNGRIVAMLGFDGWTDSACQVHIALEYRSALRHVLRAGFELPFLRCGRSVIVCQVLSTNTASLALVKHLGFREVFVGRDWWAPGVDLHWFEMRRDECRWIPKERWVA